MKVHPKTDTVTHEDLADAINTSELRFTIVTMMVSIAFVVGIIIGAMLT